MDTPSTSSSSVSLPFIKPLPKPSHFLVRTLHPNRSVEINIGISTLDSLKKLNLNALLDSGATGLFFDKDFVERNNLPTKKLARSVPVLNVDGTRNEAGNITEIVEVQVLFQGHRE